MGFPMNRDSLCFSVKKILEEVPNVTPFKDNYPRRISFEKVMQRHSELSQKQAEYINKARALVTPEKNKQIG